MVKGKLIQILFVKRWKERIPASIKAKLPAHAVAMDDEPTKNKRTFPYPKKHLRNLNITCHNK